MLLSLTYTDRSA